MFSDIFIHIAVFAYNSILPLFAIVMVLTILNFVRTRLVAARKRNAAKRNAAAKKSSTTFDPFAPVRF
jgi:hypothetical protein